MQASPYTEARQNRWNGDRTPQALFSFGYCLGRQSTMLFPGQGTGSSWWYGATGGFYWWKEVAPYGFGTDQGWINECKMALRSYKEITGVRIHLSRKKRYPEIKEIKQQISWNHNHFFLSFLLSFGSSPASKNAFLAQDAWSSAHSPVQRIFLWAQNALVISVSSIRKPFWRTEITGRPGSKENEEAVERLCIPYTHKKSKQLSFQRQIAFILVKLVQDVRGG